jgi:hypothetical protein
MGPRVYVRQARKGPVVVHLRRALTPRRTESNRFHGSARAFLTQAERLVTSPHAADCRTAISRAFYAVFHVAAAHLRQTGFPIGRGAAAHGEVLRCPANSGEPSVSDVASELSDLHSARNRADYQLDRLDVEQPETARPFVDMADVIIKDLDVAFRGPARGKIQDAIRQWRKANGYP